MKQEKDNLCTKGSTIKPTADFSENNRAMKQQDCIFKLLKPKAKQTKKTPKQTETLSLNNLISNNSAFQMKTKLIYFLIRKKAEKICCTQNKLTT